LTLSIGKASFARVTSSLRPAGVHDVRGFFLRVLYSMPHFISGAELKAGPDSSAGLQIL
jgi:hypothetical protein